MRDEAMTRDQLINELAKLRQKNLELEQALQHRNNLAAESKAILKSDPTLPLADNQRIHYQFSDLVDVNFLVQLLDSFYKFTEIPNAIVDINNNLLAGIGWQDICKQFHRVAWQTNCRCQQSDLYIADHLHERPYFGYRCLNGLMDYSTPIIIEGQHLATIFLGQFFHEPPDKEFFLRQAQENGFDETAYMQALERVPVISENKIESIMAFYSQLGQLLGTLGLERKRHLQAANSAIKDREERLRLVLEASTDGFWEWDIKTGAVTFSKYWADLLGYAVEDFFPHISTWEALLHPDDRDETLSMLTAHLEGKTEKFIAEYRMLSKLGRWQWFQGRGQVVIRDDEGKALLMVGAFFDLSERKIAESALRLSEEKFSKVFNYNPDLMCISTLKEGRYIEINDAFVAVAGYTREEAIGHTAEELHVWPVPQDRDDLLQKIQNERHIRGFELSFKDKAGEIRTVIYSGEILDIDGEPHLLSVIKDISDRKAIEEALRSSEERFSKSFNAAPIPMCISNLEDARFIDINDNYCKVLGFTRNDLIGNSALDLGIWENPAQRRLVYEKITQMESITNMEITFRMKSGEQRLGLYSAVGLMINAKACLLSMLIDITERKQMEHEMNRLGQLNLVGEMAASIGHEIRNPMTTVRGFLQILRDNEVYKNEIEYFDLMIEEMDRANLIISEFLSLGKNKMLEKKWDNLNTIIQTVLPLVQANALTVDRYLHIELEPIPDLLMDGKEISQLVLNLVNNALESMPAGGTVTIHTFTALDKVVLAVQDQGHGIERNLIDKLGTPFFTTKDQGVGLGLAICYRIASRHNASIDLDTNENGTTFWVRFSTS